MQWRKRKQEREQRGSNWLDQCRRRHSWWENMDVVFSSVMCRRFWGCYCGCWWNPEINTDVREKKFLVKEQYSTCFFRSIVNRQLVWNCCDTWKVCPFSITDNGLDVSQVIQIKLPWGKAMDSELTHIGLRQLFYELKQIYPSVPDHIVTNCIRQVNW